MKTLIFGLLVIGFTSLGFSQDKNEGISVIQLDDVEISSLNYHYLRTVQDESTPNAVKQIQLVAANYDITSNPRYDKKAIKPFEVVFRSKKGKIIAYYDNKGEILSSDENFKNVLLPLVIRKKLIVENIGWEMKSNQYLCSYYDDKVVTKMLKIGLTDGKHTKKLRIDLNQ